MALDEEGAAVRVEAGGEQQHGQPAALGAQLGGLVGHRHGVEVDHAEDGVGPGLVVHPAPDRADVVAQVHLACGLDSGEDSGHRRARIPGSPGPQRVSSTVVVLTANGVRGEHPGLRGPVRPPAAPDPQGRGGALGGLPGPGHRRVPRRGRAPRPARPRRRHRVPADRLDARRAQGAPPAPGRGHDRARRGAAAVRGARPAPRPAARVQDVQGRGPVLEGHLRVGVPVGAAHRRSRRAVPLHGAGPARAGHAQGAPGRGASVGSRRRSSRRSTRSTSRRSGRACATPPRRCCCRCRSTSR